MAQLRSVDEYIENSPIEVREKLKELRKIIKSTVPKAEEKISYGMPYYGYRGRLAYFALFKTHIGLYVMPPVVEEFKSELKDYKTAVSTIQFPLDKKLPVELIKKLIKARVKKNEEAT